MKNASKFKNIVLGSMIAVAVASAPLATFAHENEKGDDSHKGVKVEARANIGATNGKFHFPFWGWRGWHWGWFKHNHGNGNNNGNTTTTVPVLSNIDTSKIDQDEATITWTTDVNSSTYIWYGTDSSVDTSDDPTITKSGSATKSHSIHITGLNDDTKYYFVIGSGTTAGKAKSGTMSFTTSDEDADDTDPVISNISSTTGSTSTTITWKTDENATSKVYYSTNTPVDTGSASTVVNNSLTKNHSITINNLSTSTLYHYKIESKDDSGNTELSNELSFTTSS
jgi:hypothetical protein